jgi:phosphoinositide-3-kinase regulatory subunit 4
LKTIKAVNDEGTAFIIKVFIKRSPEESLMEYQTNLLCMCSVVAIAFLLYQNLVEKDQLMGLPNLMPYDVVLETASHGFAIRQYLHSSLYDRIRY